MKLKMGAISILPVLEVILSFMSYLCLVKYFSKLLLMFSLLKMSLPIYKYILLAVHRGFPSTETFLFFSFIRSLS